MRCRKDVTRLKEGLDLRFLNRPVGQAGRGYAGFDSQRADLALSGHQGFRFKSGDRVGIGLVRADQRPAIGAQRLDEIAGKQGGQVILVQQDDMVGRASDGVDGLRVIEFQGANQHVDIGRAERSQVDPAPIPQGALPQALDIPVVIIHRDISRFSRGVPSSR